MAPPLATLQAHRPLCFVLMPFGTKPDGMGGTVNFDKVYHQLIKPAIEQAGLEPLRADEEVIGGFIHKPMFERLLLCEYAVADLTAANANVFYELGVRHAARPWSTVLLFAQGGRLPFDIAPIRTLPYQLDPTGSPSAAETDQAALTALLNEVQRTAGEHEKGPIDSPLYQIVEGYPAIDHTKTDIFRDQVAYSETIKKQLAQARTQGLAAVQQVAATLGDLSSLEAGVLIDLLLSYRAVKSWTGMTQLVEHMPRPLADTALVQEQYGFALNRAGQGPDAERVLTDLVKRRGPSSETLGILGRVYKDQWEAALVRGDRRVAAALLDKAITTYLRGFEADWRDAYPGINAVTLMGLADKVDPRQQQLLPVVRYAVERKVSAGSPDYWDYATLLELAVLADDEAAADQYLGQALTTAYDPFGPETTARNLRLIREATERRGEPKNWIQAFETELLAAANPPTQEGNS
ncbi:TRAFs-binding domain-containing protein [Hymenobacter convexus]|uniref:TRAFs-binding domain-containing protein n=1 Tax=Hymenobacter sp. CA1UV-4 TaxID=3063782 RepID=UPI00271260F0|nr:TRAFs-binding domain-containing protein [Hymenobacter sp. CA1UV-4]MDO7854076.1 TRAFs-binding domain-containing protein [Hymenobacter sp. CA1UV-4]